MRCYALSERAATWGRPTLEFDEALHLIEDAVRGTTRRYAGAARLIAQVDVLWA